MQLNDLNIEEEEEKSFEAKIMMIEKRTSSMKYCIPTSEDSNCNRSFEKKKKLKRGEINIYSSLRNQSVRNGLLEPFEMDNCPR